MMIFNFNVRDWVNNLLPISLRKDNLIAFIQALVEPIRQLYEWFVLNRKNNLYRLDITPQVCKLEKMLNDRFDLIQRRIKIVDGDYVNNTYLYLDVENQPIFIGTHFLFQPSEVGASDKDFTVQVPTDINFDHSEMAALIETYKLTVKTFKIEII